MQVMCNAKYIVYKATENQFYKHKILEVIVVNVGICDVQRSSKSESAAGDEKDQETDEEEDKKYVALGL